jgi:DNA processing protein
MVPGIGPLSFYSLVKGLGSAVAVFSASESRLASIPGIGGKTAHSLITFPALESARRELERSESLGIRIVVEGEPGYPEQLAEIPSQPPVLYLRGEWGEEGQPHIAIVGSRRCTEYGKEIAGRLAFDLARHGLTVVSGMALGIDTAAHKGAIAAGGRTVAVWGSGLDVLYPPQNRKLAEEIARQGAIVSEFPLGTAPLSGNFPRRNRIISGLSLGVVVVEAGEKSGALLTADFASDQGREVFAVPGSIYLQGSRGCHRLIRLGAKLVEGVEDILEELRLEPLQALPPSSTEGGVELEGEEERLYRILSDRPLHIDEIIMRAHLPAGKVASLLMNLELKGYCRQESGKKFLRAR